MRDDGLQLLVILSTHRDYTPSVEEVVVAVAVSVLSIPDHWKGNDDCRGCRGPRRRKRRAETVGVERRENGEGVSTSPAD